MKPLCTSAILRVFRPGKGKGQTTTLRLYDKSQNLLSAYSGPRCHAIAGSLKRVGVEVVRV